MLVYYLYWLYCILAALCVMLVAQYYVHHLQRTSYNAKAYTAWVKKQFSRDALPLILTGVMCIMLKVCNIFFIEKMLVLSYICFYGADVLFLYMLLSIYLAYRKENKDTPTPLQYTGPAIRILAVVFLVAFVCEMNLMRQTVYYGSVTWLQYMKPYAIGYLPGMIVPLLTLVVFYITSPHLAFKKQEEQDFYMDDDPGETPAEMPAPETDLYNYDTQSDKGEDV